MVFGPALKFGKLFLIPLIRDIVHLSLKLLLIVIQDIVNGIFKNLLLIELIYEVILSPCPRLLCSCKVQTPAGSAGQSLRASILELAHRDVTPALLTSGIRTSLLLDIMLDLIKRAFFIVGLDIKWIDLLRSI